MDRGWRFWFFFFSFIQIIIGEDNLFEKFPAEDMESLSRKPRKMGTPGEEDFLGVDKPKYENKNDRGNRNRNRNRNRNGNWGTINDYTINLNTSSPSLPTRGSKKPVTLKVPLLTPGDTRGCGNPVCVIIDSKPRRFLSICKLIKYLKGNMREKQMNFVQKGDCYDIINGEQALDKPWTSESSNNDCSACLNDVHCNQFITVNIDIMSILYGNSSAFGGQTFHDVTSPRMVGVPLEFPNVCEMMRYMAGKHENLNIKTQVIGIAIGRRDELFPTQANSDTCLWTEWFDHDTPCNNDGDHEKHTDHYQRLDGTMTGPVRICKPGDIVETQYEGGSESYQVTAQVAANGNALGSDGTVFKQEIMFNTLSIKCDDERQTESKLPPPFIFGEGIKGNRYKNASCLDYKMRYCCKSKTLFRQEPTQNFLSKLPPKIPVGPMVGTVVKNRNSGLLESATIEIHPIHRTSSDSSATINIVIGNPASNEFTGTATILGRPPVDIEGSFTKIERKANGTLKWYTYRFAIRKESKFFGKIILNYNIDEGDVTTIGLINNHGAFAQSSVIKMPDDTPDKFLRTLITDKKQRGKMTTIMHDFTNDNLDNRINMTGTLNVDQTNRPEDLRRLAGELIANHNIPFFIDSPPLALLFAECEWKDFVNLEYPDKYRTGAEWELRLKAATYGGGGPIPKRRYFRKHVCGRVPEMALYVDAVTVEDQTPWYELTHNGQPYETYKLSPYHGYICNDQNMLGNGRHCKDMKVRYCCAKELRAQWSEWGAWSDCTKPCGCGYTTRKKQCVQSRYRKAQSALYKLAYNPTCHGDDTEPRRRLFSQQTKACNVEPCPVDYHWTIWTQWSHCSKTCLSEGDQQSGTKTRKRFCSPAINGGKECPDRRFELGPHGNSSKYFETKECTPPDCTFYYPGPWLGWSPCSQTCGKGTRDRKRLCIEEDSQQPIYDDKVCDLLTVEGQMQQSQMCKLQECPVDGDWCKWSEYSSCSQHCVPFNATMTMAKRTKKRDCSCPLPAYGGKQCDRDDGFEWISHSNVQQHTKPCITPEDLPNPGPDPVTGYVPWCPENCVLTEWSEWGGCGATCVPTLVTDFTYDHYDNETDPSKVFGKYIIVKPMLDVPIMPRRIRYRTVYKEQRFGGSCVVENFWTKYRNDTDSMTRMILQHEDCRLCDEHCNIHGNNGILDAEPLSYPGNDNQCVGFCPLDCTWGPSTEKNCETFKQDFFRNPGSFHGFTDEVDNQFMKDNVCYLSFVMKLLKQHKRTNELNNFKQELKMAIEAATREDDDFYIPYNVVSGFPRAFQQMFSRQSMRSCSVCKLIRVPIQLAWNLDRQMIVDFHQTTETRYANIPNLDGFYGGEACKRTWSDQKNLTIRRDDDQKFDSSTMHNLIPEDIRIDWGECQLTFCDPREYPPCPRDHPLYPDCPPVWPTPVCVAAWSEWGPWGQCDQSVGGQNCGGSRDRRRRCKCTCAKEACLKKCAHGDLVCKGKCAEKEFPDPSKCRPFNNTVKNRTFTDTDKTLCSPCFMVTPEWSQWNSWSNYNSTIKLCYEEGEQPGVITQTRQRHCFHNIKNANDPCECDPARKGVCDTETRTMPMAACPATEDVCEPYCTNTTTTTTQPSLQRNKKHNRALLDITHREDEEELLMKQMEEEGMKNNYQYEYDTSYYYE